MHFSRQDVDAFFPSDALFESGATRVSSTGLASSRTKESSSKKNLSSSSQSRTANGKDNSATPTHNTKFAVAVVREKSANFASSSPSPEMRQRSSASPSPLYRQPSPGPHTAAQTTRTARRPYTKISDLQLLHDPPFLF
jgi:hypothetical protein